VKLHPHLGGFHILDRKLLKLIEQEIAPRSLPILSHVGNDAPNVQPADFFRLANQFPGTHFVAAHLANGILGSSHGGINAWQTLEPKNVWMDMATLRAFQTGKVQEYVREIGEDRICFGTDAPLYWAPAFSHFLEKIALSSEAKEKIGWKNALAAFPKLRN
jgi:predicted TIM-barrel fold metal-dependent hydrolase